MFWIAFTFIIADEWSDYIGDFTDEMDDELGRKTVKLPWIPDSYYSYGYTSVRYRHWRAVMTLPEFFQTLTHE